MSWKMGGQPNFPEGPQMALCRKWCSSWLLAAGLVLVSNWASAADFTPRAVPVGSVEKLSLSLGLSVTGPDRGQTGVVMVAALLPNGNLYVLTPNGWSPFDGKLPALFKGVLGEHEFPLFSNTDLTPYVGTTVYIGYGKTEQDMLARRLYSGIYTVPAAPASAASKSARFLAQATFGPRPQDIEQVAATGYESWLTTQFNTPATLLLPKMLASAEPDARNTRMETWWHIALTGQDQLRQRVALALSEIFVVSDRGNNLGDHQAIAYYHDLLAKDAFGNFRTLLEDVTLSPAMGLYLNMLGNQKPDPENNIHADENYARELMQLFSIGLVQLNADGTIKTDAQGKPLPTYTQADVTNLARVLTGWSWNRAGFYDGPENNLVQMVPFAEYHDTDAKTIIGGVRIPAGKDARSELKVALDTLFNHPNVGPFIGRQLIQRLVTSNPTPAYVGRVAQVFANNGKGVRGDMQAVVRAILLDPEARDTAPTNASFGKRREPLLMVSHVWRALNASAGNGKYQFWYPDWDLGQAPYSAPSVFNFYKPRYVPAGPLKMAGLVGPEFQRVDASSIVQLSNWFSYNVFEHEKGNPEARPEDILLDFEPLRALAGNPDSGPLVDRLNLLLLSGQMTATSRRSMVNYLNTLDTDDRGKSRIQEALFLIMTSPQYQIQK
ncbi:DUF1800 domain-containing protein [Parachitinimonas caeni]|uniref:DUF1800 domain-containing protein n=1 Tax=Parachitinimonas caeni TaxID=3031301 RepID=A0ABT7E0Y6_9NEIS|nr:DUF1800 domain-containing protein [Parachitinimonas caeni]MDK2125080.1 DUF1800 domain-containing protein [Parachitinimonas caeni]